MSTLHFELGHDGVALLSIDVHGRPMNVLTLELITELDAAIQRIQTDAAIKGAIITSAKPGSFLAGTDLKDLTTAHDRGMTPAQATLVSSQVSGLFRKLETCGKPIAAVINGPALGSGLELCLACHYRVLSDDPKAVIGFPEVKVGVLPGAGGTQRLPRLVGIPAALPLLLQDRSLPPAEALTVGLVHEVAAHSDLFDTARRWLSTSPKASQPWDQKTFTIPGGAGPLAPHANQTFVAGTALLASNRGDDYPTRLAILSCVYEGTMVAFDVGLRIESKYFGKLLGYSGVA
jgi:3-hydroxyacyl-CoA dehydrogenase/enoyl-CoA hydratase/3-hydroxybutyryl-CoA epimerase